MKLIVGTAAPVFVLSPAGGRVKAAPPEETLVWRLVALARALSPVERLVPGTGLGAGALAGVRVEGMSLRAGRRQVAHTLAADGVQVSVGPTVPARTPTLTHTLAGVDVHLLVGTAHIGPEKLCRVGERTQLENRYDKTDD